MKRNERIQAIKWINSKTIILSQRCCDKVYVLHTYNYMPYRTGNTNLLLFDLAISTSVTGLSNPLMVTVYLNLDRSLSCTGA